MKFRLFPIIGWISALLVAALTLFSAVMEFMPVTDPVTLGFIESLGVGDIAVQLGVTKIIITLLYLIPRTSTIGFVLMVGYYGGALATNITHGFTVDLYAPILVVFVLLTISAAIRNPELLSRMKGKA